MFYVYVMEVMMRMYMGVFLTVLVSTMTTSYVAL